MCDVYSECCVYFQGYALMGRNRWKLVMFRRVTAGIGGRRLDLVDDGRRWWSDVVVGYVYLNENKLMKSQVM